MKTLAWLLVPCLAANAAGAAPPSVTCAADAPALVRQLGADAYETRERASRLLAFLGKASIPALREGQKGRDAEVRCRCARLLARLDRPVLEPRLQALMDGKDTFTPPLPGWAKFRELAGADFAVRSLYVEVDKADRVVLEWVQGGSDPAARIDYRWQQSELNKRITEVEAKAATGSGVGEIALVLLLATSEPKDDRTSYYATHRALSRPVVYRHLRADETLVGTYALGRTTLRAELRDVALAAVVQLAGGKLGAVGFPYPTAIPGLCVVPSPACLGFANEAQRSAAFSKGRALAAER